LVLASRGAYVLAVGRDGQRAKGVVAEIEGGGGSATFRLTSLADLESARDLVEWATLAGDGHVDILVADLIEILASRAVALGRA
jgi:NAD(P)-dependent dehydrogenase (short-subunit alcohol dehydrogenase family)